MARNTYATVAALATQHGLTLTCWSPGDGPRYRVFAGAGRDYFDSDGLFTAFSLREALAFIRGYAAAEQEMIAQDEAHNGPIPSFLRRQA